MAANSLFATKPCVAIDLVHPLCPILRVLKLIFLQINVSRYCLVFALGATTVEVLTEGIY